MGRPKNCISVTKAKELQKNWNDTRALDIERVLGARDINAVTFNIDQLQVKNRVGLVIFALKNNLISI